jgi:hypothetical protein
MLEFKDILSPLATIFTGVLATRLAIKGWNKNAEENRKHHIFQERLKRRLAMFDSLLPVVKKINKSGVLEQHDLDNLAKAWVAIQLYGYESEIAILTKFIKAVENAHENRGEVPKEDMKDVPTLLLKLRTELGYPSGSVTEKTSN